MTKGILLGFLIIAVVSGLVWLIPHIWPALAAVGCVVVVFCFALVGSEEGWK